MDNNYILTLKNITKEFPGVKALDDVTINIERGTIHGLVGENGAGKSTLIKVLAGIYQPNKGEIILDGKPCRFNSPIEARRAGISVVHQEIKLAEPLSVAENMFLGNVQLKNGLVDWKGMRRRAREIVEDLGMDIDINAQVSSLTVAKKQIVEIMHAINNNSRILIMDEPSAVLTDRELEVMFRIVKQLRDEGITIIYISHRLDEIFGLCSNVSVLRDGCHIDTIPVASVDRQGLINMMVGREVMLTIDKKITDHKKDVLKVSGLNVRDDRQILRVKNASFTLKEGEILGIVGVSGNGQNELVEAITGLRSWENGEVLLDDEPLTCGSIRNRRLHQIGYVPQDRIRYGSSRDSSLVENCIMGYHLQHLRKKKFLMDYNAAASFTKDIVSNYKVKAGSIQDRAGSLSGGNLQKLIVGREFSQNNKVLVIEDPTRGIDVGAIEFIWHEIQKQVEEEGVSVILITYDLNEAMTLSDRILVMFDGNFNHEFAGPDYDEKEIGLYMMGGGSNEKDA